MGMRANARTIVVRASWATAALLVAASIRAEVIVKSRTGATPEVSATDKTSKCVESTTGKACATASPLSLSAITQKKGDNSPFPNGANATFRETARVVGGGGSVRLSFAFGGTISCSSEPGGTNPSSGRIGGGANGKSNACSISCSAGLPMRFADCNGATIQGRITNVNLTASAKIPVTPDLLKGLVPSLKEKIEVGDLGDLPALAALIAQEIKQRGFNKPPINLPKGTDVKVGFDVQFFVQVPPMDVTVSSAGLVIANVFAVASAMQSSSSRAEVQGSGSFQSGLTLSTLALARDGRLTSSVPGPVLLSATTKGPVPPGMKVVFEESKTEIEVRQETACSDGIDNDGDGLTDFPADRGCETPFSTSESPAVLPLDSDGDLIFDSADNCPFVFNPMQEDRRGTLSLINPDGLLPDGIGDACQ